MKHNKIVIGLALCASAHSTSAATINIDRDLDVGGAVSGGSYFLQHPSFNQRSLNTQLHDFLIEVSTKDRQAQALNATLGLGALSTVSVAPTSPTGQGTPISTGIQYGWFDYKADKVNLELGHIATRVGYESSFSYQNAHISRGVLWNTQPAFYPGIRGSSKVNNFDVYAEYTNSGPSRQAGAFGASGKSGEIGYSISYYDEKRGNNIIDVIVELQKADMKIGVNFDLVTMDVDPGQGVDDDAMGVAVFTSFKANEMEIPLRVEYVKDGNSGLYGGVDDGLTVTLTPGKWLDKQTYIRGEVAFASTKNKVFSDDDGKTKDSQLTLGLQAGMLF